MRTRCGKCDGEKCQLGCGMPRLPGRRSLVTILAGCAVGLALLFALSASGCATTHRVGVRLREPAPAGTLIADVSVFDGERFSEHQDVLVRQGTIAAVVPAGSQAFDANLERIDGRGKTLLPGLIDLHVHLNMLGSATWDVRQPDVEGAALAQLYAGVTSALVATHQQPEADLAQAAQEHEALAPHLYLAGPGLTAPDGHPIALVRAILPWPFAPLATRTILTASAPHEAREAVRQVAREQRLSFFKVIYESVPEQSPKLSRESLVAAVSEARSLGLRPIVHVGTAQEMVDAAHAGAALIMHVPYRDRLTPAQARHLAELKVPFVTTNRAFWAGRDAQRSTRTALECEMVDPRMLEALAHPPPPGDDAWGEEWVHAFAENMPQYKENLAANIRLLIDSGVPWFVGTDSGVPGVFQGAGFHAELESLEALGIPAAKLLRAATASAAKFLEPEGRFGRVQAGYRADLLLVRGDPTRSIRELAAIEAVFLEGRPLEREPVQPGQKCEGSMQARR